QHNQPEAALEVIDQGLSIVGHNSERFFEAELYRLKARALLMRGAPAAEIETLLEQALRTARSQEARSLELRAATDLARLWMNQGMRDEALEVLGSTYGHFTEGFDTRDLTSADTLLPDLRSGLLPFGPSGARFPPQKQPCAAHKPMSALSPIPTAKA